MEKCKEKNTVSSGYNNLDNIIEGFKPGTLVGVFSSAFMGRTSFLINLLINVKLDLYLLRNRLLIFIKK